jgi:hypothetical protein
MGAAVASAALPGHHPRMRAHFTFAVLLLLGASCSSLQYDLATVPFPVSASPAPAGQNGEPFEAKDSLVMYGYGLFGESQPDVAGKLREACGDCAGVADFRVSASASFHAWLATHLSLGLVRYKVVTIRGTRLPKR